MMIQISLIMQLMAISYISIFSKESDFEKMSTIFYINNDYFLSPGTTIIIK